MIADIPSQLEGWGTLFMGVGTLGTLLWTIIQQRTINRHKAQINDLQDKLGPNGEGVSELLHRHDQDLLKRIDGG